MRSSLMNAAGRKWLRRARTSPACPATIQWAGQRLPKDCFAAARNASTARHDSRKPKIDLVAIDKKWQQIWQTKLVDSRKTDQRLSAGGSPGQRRLKYILPMFPYPSGNLHLGHLRVYTIADVLARFRRMQGYDTLHPMAWDAFGLPAENAAIERGVDPAEWTKLNIAKMKSQLLSMNGVWDWDREFATCDPSFYKHTQRIFLLLHERGFAYQAESLVNYDPVDKTVLANEQVDANGCSWRSGAKVEQRLLKQWFLKISAFRDALLDDLDVLAKDNRWPERVISMQRNWLGKSEGARLKFPVIAYDQRQHANIEVFTTRPDTLFGVQYVALSANHPIVTELAASNADMQTFVDSIADLPPDSKTGYLIPSIRAVNPIAFDESTPDATKASLPVYIAPYVLGDYGQGAVMGVPGHDTRDFAFWKANRGEEAVRFVIEPLTSADILSKVGPFVHKGRLASNCGTYSGRESEDASTNIVKLLEANGEFAQRAETWRLRDWLVSRQRYWGTPIPIIHCDSCGSVPVPVNQLPVELPKLEGHWFRGKAGNPLDVAHEWVNTSCPKCGGQAKRDTDTMDTFVDSSWYYMRFADAQNGAEPFSPQVAEDSLPVDMYIGGVEHAILHLLYARFITKFLATTPLFTSTSADGSSSTETREPFHQLLTQGMVHGKTYSDPSNGRFLKPSEVDVSNAQNPVVKATGQTAIISFEKMSKSKQNGVDPSDCFSKYGADATRAHILFQAPVSEVLEWDEERISGVIRWMRRVEDLVHLVAAAADTTDSDALSSLSSTDNEATRYFAAAAKPGDGPELDAHVAIWRAVQTTLASVTESLATTHALNTVVSDLMGLSNTVAAHAAAARPAFLAHAVSALLRMMAPVTPAFAEECWEMLCQRGGDGKAAASSASSSIFDAPFPRADGSLLLRSLQSDTQPCAVQVNGKLRFVLEVDKAPPPGGLLTAGGGEEEELKKRWFVRQVLESEEGRKRMERTGEDWAAARKIVVVRGGKTINFVL